MQSNSVDSASNTHKSNAPRTETGTQLDADMDVLNGKDTIEIQGLDSDQLKSFTNEIEESIKEKDEKFRTWQNQVKIRRKDLHKRSVFLLDQKKNRLKVYENITSRVKSTIDQESQWPWHLVQITYLHLKFVFRRLVQFGLVQCE